MIRFWMLDPATFFQTRMLTKASDPVDGSPSPGPGRLQPKG